MSVAASLPRASQDGSPPLQWGRLLYLSMLVVIGLLSTYPAYNHVRICGYEQLRQEITSAGGRAARYRGGSRAGDEFYWSALGGNLSSVVIRQVEYPPFAAVQPSVLPRLRRCSELERLHLDGQQLDAAMWREVFRMVQLEELRIGYCDLTDDLLRGLENLENLRTLDLQGSAITDASLDRLAGMTSLEDIDLRNTDISPAGASRLSRLLPEAKIRHSAWPSPEHRQAALRLFRRGAQLESSESSASGINVQLVRHQWRGTADDLGDLANLHGLQALELRGLDLDAPLLKSIAQLPNVTTLLIVSGPLRDADFSLLTASPSLRAMVLADVFVQPLTAEGIASLDRIEKLALVNVRLVPGTLATLVQSGSVRELSLISMRLRPATTDELSAAASLKRLEFVRTAIADSQLDAICGLAGLENLGLNGGQISDESIGTFAKMTALRRLDVSGTLLTRQGIQELRSALPNCRVETQVDHPTHLDVVEFLHGIHLHKGAKPDAAAR